MAAEKLNDTYQPCNVHTMHKVHEWKDVIQKGINIPFCKRQSIVDSYSLLHLIASKYMSPNSAALYISGEGGYTHGGVDMSPIMVQKSGEQMKKVREAMENEIRKFQVSGEVTLPFKDAELYKRFAVIEDNCRNYSCVIIGMDERITELEKNISNIRQYSGRFHMIEHLLVNLDKQSELNHSQTAVIVNMGEKIATLEKQLSQNRDQMLAFEHLLTILAEQKSNVSEAEAIEPEALEQEALEQEEDSNTYSEASQNSVKVSTDEDYDGFLCVFIPAVTVLVIALLFTLYQEMRRSSPLHIIDFRLLPSSKDL